MPANPADPSVNDDDTTARFRVRAIGAFSPKPAGRRLPLSAAGFGEAMASAGLAAEVSVPDRLGGQKERKLALAFARPRAFSLAEVVAAVPELAKLRTLAEALGAGTTTPEVALGQVKELVGEGPLARALALAIAAATPAPPAAGTPATGVDAIFAAGDVKPAAEPAAGAIDTFVRTMRGPSAPRPPASAAASRGVRAARTAIEEAVFATAGDVLADPLVARLEGVWRGLKLLVDQCPAAAQIAIELVDAPATDAVAALERDLPDDESDRPDLLVVIDPVADVDTLARLAGVGESALAPVVVALAPSLVGVADAAAVALAADQPGGCLPEAFVALRADESSRWLCGVLNRGVVASEGVGTSKRTAFTSPALVLAAQLAASFRDTRAFARIFGGNGAIELPATLEVSEGKDAGSAIPTEAFYSLRAQTALAGQGLLGLGSARNSSKVALSAAPTARHSTDAVPLPAQILTGKLVRFVSWVRRELPADASDADAVQMFEQAAQVFLFAGMGEGAILRAGVGKDEQGRRVVEIAASLRAEHAAIPFQMAFTLPLS